MNAAALRVLGVVAAVVVVWEVVTALGWVSAIILPRPTELVDAARRDGALFVEGFLVTAAEIFIAMAIAWTIGVATGVVAGSFARIAGATGPLLSSLFAVPLIILYPLFMAWLGIGSESKIVFGVLSGYFPIALNTMNGVRAIDDRFLTMARGAGASRWQIYTRVVLPLALPSIVSGLRVGSGLVIIGVIVTEMLASIGGLGFLISYHRTLFNTGHVYLGILLALLVAVGMNWALTRLERRFGGWRVAEQAER